MKCPSLCPDDHEHMKDNADIWYCSLCISKMFPLNSIEEGDTFLCELNGIDIDRHTIESLSDSLFNPFQLNDKDYHSPLSQIDPDFNFYKNINSHLWLNCNHYMEKSFYDLIKTRTNCLTSRNVFSLCHINIRSLRANLSSLEITLDNLKTHFIAIGVSETWLNDQDCDLYNIEG